MAATSAVAAAAGIGVFATGGLGGVHREAAQTFDESADLVTLARTPIAVVCAGVKSILDVGATLERLETLGVGVVGYRTRRFPGFYLHCFSPTEIHGLTKVTGRSAEEILIELRDAGLRSIPGGGGEILVDAIRKRRRSSCSTDEWLGISATAHRLGIPTTATMMIGLGEEPWMRAEHLERVRQVQDETGGFISFIPWTFQPDNTPLGRAIPNRVPAEEYLRWHAAARLVLDNVPNQQVSWLTVGLEAGKKGLRAGANDLGSIMIEENVISAAGASHKATEQMLRTVIAEEGFRPVKRNAGYKILEE